MSTDTKGSGFIFGLTLTELIIITFFILFLLMTSKMDEQEIIIAELADESKQQSNSLEKISELIGFPIESEQFFKELVSARDVKMLAEDAGISTEAISQLQREKEDLTLLAKTQKGQLKYFQDISKGSGDGIPPCWVDENKVTEYMFSVLIKDSLIYTEAIYPPHREREFQAIPDVDKLVLANAVDIEYFLLNTKAAFEVSKNREPECRFYVRIYDDSTNVDIFKPMLVKVQSHFYPYLGIHGKPPEELLQRSRKELAHQKPLTITEDRSKPITTPKDEFEEDFINNLLDDGKKSVVKSSADAKLNVKTSEMESPELKLSAASKLEASQAEHSNEEDEVSAETAKAARKCSNTVNLRKFGTIKPRNPRRIVERKVGVPCWAIRDVKSGDIFWYYTPSSESMYVKFSEEYRVLEVVL
jgi:hypothetical protein